MTPQGSAHNTPRLTVTRNVLTRAQCRAVIGAHHGAAEHREVLQGQIEASPPAYGQWQSRWRTIITAAAQELELPVEGVAMWTRRCKVGSGWLEHTDNVENGFQHQFRELTMSFTIALNDSSEFEGGQLTFPGHPAPQLQAGDMVAFNGPEVPHSVSVLTSGERWIVIGFCGLAAR